MNYLFAVNHPSQFHTFKNLALKLIEDKHKCIFFIQQRGIIEILVKQYGFDYRYSVSPSLRNAFRGRAGVFLRGLISLLQQEWRVLYYNLGHKVDFMMGSDVSISHVGFLLRRKVLVFADDDYAIVKPFCHLVYPFTTHIVASKVVDVHRWESKKISYYGTQKSSYLHPSYFSPDEKVLDKYNLRGCRFFIIRLVSFTAIHDAQHSAYTGISEYVLDSLISKLKVHGKIILSLEEGYREKHAEHIMKVDPQDMHSLIYYADMLIGDSQSMHIEAALLGTPSIRSNKWVHSEHKMSVIDYLETKYDLCFSISPDESNEIIKRALSFLEPGTKERGETQRKLYFQENTNLTEFIYWIMSDYPANLEKWKMDSTIVKRFI